MKNKRRFFVNIYSFIKYAISKKNPWSLLLSLSVILNALTGIYTVFTPKWVLKAVRVNQELSGRLFAFILFITVGLFILKFSTLLLQSKLDFYSDELFRNAYADLGLLQSNANYEVSILPEHLTMLEGGKYGIWEIPPLSDKLTKLGSSIVLLFMNIGIFLFYDYKYLIIPTLTLLLLLPLHRFVMNIELDNVRRLLPENRAFGWYCRLISDFRLGEDIRIYKGESMILEQCGLLMEKIYDINQKAFSHKGILLGLIKFMFQIQVVIIALLLGQSFIKSDIGVENFALLFTSICTISSTSNDIVMNFNHIKKLDTLLAPFITLQNSQPNKLFKKNEHLDNKVYSLTFEHVSFTYPGSSKKALDDVSFTFTSNEKVGIVGRNGAGKSTIVKLISGLYQPQKGRILIDGVDVTTLSEEQYRDYLCVLFQDFQLFPVTIIENILCKKSRDITETDRNNLEVLFEGVDFKHWLCSLSKGLDTYISPTFSDNYVMPSGGQTQVLGMLRAIIRNASICLFDEPTTALDPHNEQIILNQLADLQGTICIMISHRLSHVKLMDHIIVMDKGKLVERGNHNELIKQNGIYNLMYRYQAKKYNVNF